MQVVGSVRRRFSWKYGKSDLQYPCLLNQSDPRLAELSGFSSAILLITKGPRQSNPFLCRIILNHSNFSLHLRIPFSPQSYGLVLQPHIFKRISSCLTPPLRKCDLRKTLKYIQRLFKVCIRFRSVTGL